jgi:predicted RNA polymerase sigma factor
MQSRRHCWRPACSGRDGLPASPRGWLIHVAARRLTDEIRAEIARRRREAVVMLEMTPEAAPPPDAVVPADQDDTLNLLVMCCHPALTRPSAIALTLRAVGGLSTAEIARAFLVPEPTMAQRISRAKASIKASGIPLSRPSPVKLNDRLDAVLHVLYLIFNEGYTATGGATLQRTDLSAVHAEAARAEDTDWPQILALYGVLERIADNPMVTLNRVVAQSMVHGAAAGLKALAPLDVAGRLAGHHRLHAVRAHLLERAGDRAAAATQYRVAAGKTPSLPEQRYLLTRAAVVDTLRS